MIMTNLSRVSIVSNLSQQGRTELPFEALRHFNLTLSPVTKATTFSLGMFRDFKRCFGNSCYHFVTPTSKHTDSQWRTHFASGNNPHNWFIFNHLRYARIAL